MYTKADVIWDKKINESTIYLEKENGEQTKISIGNIYSWKDTIEMLTRSISAYGLKITAQDYLDEDNFYKEQTLFLG